MTTMNQQTNLTKEEKQLLINASKVFDLNMGGIASFLSEYPVKTDEFDTLKVQDYELPPEEKFLNGEKPLDPFTDRPFNPEDYEYREYILRPVFQTACFTEKAAQDYINCNGHNIIGREYRKPRIYVASGWRNQEWQQIREYLIDKAMVESNNVSV